VSWNILAQGLVRRKLFPGSDCMKWKDREAPIKAEMTGYDWDVAAFQEVDRIETHGPNLHHNGKNFIYAKGYEDKQHGLLIAWRTTSSKDKSMTAFNDEAEASKVIFFDRECVDGRSGQQGKRTALSRVTRNIALLVALRFKDQPENGSCPKGIIVATTHLFWHPMHAYERVRQMGLLKRRLIDWRDANADWSDWPLIVAGDFNDQPHSATYKLVTGEAFSMHCIEEIRHSTVVHQSVDELAKMVKEDVRSGSANEAIVVNGGAAQADGIGQGSVVENLQEEIDDGLGDEGGAADEEEEGEDDQMLKNCRPATTQDALLTFEEFVQLHDLSRSPPSAEASEQEGKADEELLSHRPASGLFSLYGQNFSNLEEDQSDNFFGSTKRWRERHDDADWSPDAPNPHLDSSFEPMYTLFSALFSLTLDYIFVFPAKDSQKPAVVTTALLPTHRTATLKPGIPRLGICASDHAAIGAEFVV
jgi:RNA exonuclease NGL2